MRALAADVTALPYAGGSLAALESALAGNGPEHQGIVAIDGDRVTGVVVFGSIAGADRAGRLYLVATGPVDRRRGAGRMLIEGAVHALRESRHRFVSVEIADDPLMVVPRVLLERVGFRVEATVGDYFRDGVALSILRRDIGDQG